MRLPGHMWFLECTGWLPRCNYVVVRVFLIVVRMLWYAGSKLFWVVDRTFLCKDVAMRLQGYSEWCQDVAM